MKVQMRYGSAVFTIVPQILAVRDECGMLRTIPSDEVVLLPSEEPLSFKRDSKPEPRWQDVTDRCAVHADTMVCEDDLSNPDAGDHVVADVRTGYRLKKVRLYQGFNVAPEGQFAAEMRECDAFKIERKVES